MNKQVNETYAYVYRWTEISSGKWYIGSRTANGCHPNDGYICSSKTVKPLIKNNPDNWKREILCIGMPDDMHTLEYRLLHKLDARRNTNSYNKSNGDPGWTSEPWNKGLTGAQTAWNKGVTGEDHHRYGKKLGYKKPHAMTEKFTKWVNELKETNYVKNTTEHTCPHCGKIGKGPAMKQWHFDQCKSLKGGI